MSETTGSQVMRAPWQGFFRKIYQHSPFPSNHKSLAPPWFLFLSPVVAWKQARKLVLERKVQEFTMKIQWRSPAYLERRRDFLLRRLVHHAYENVPFYHRWFKENCLSPASIKHAGDLERLPVVTKDDIKRDFDAFTARNFREFEPSIEMTSGSTGVPFRFYTDYMTDLHEAKAVWRHWKVGGISPRDRICVLRGNLVDRHGRTKQDLFVHDKLGKVLYLNTFNMNKENSLRIISLISQFRPALLRVYPTSLYVLAKYVSRLGVRFPSIKMIHFSSEGYPPEFREYVEEVFDAPVYDRYGQSECVLSAFECERKEGYHVEEDNGILEIVDGENNPVDEGESGSMLATSLINMSMPFIRYRTEDFAAFKEGARRCSCGRGFSLLSRIEGRLLDIIFAKDLTPISGISFYHYWKHRIGDLIPEVVYVRVIQEKLGTLDLEMLVTPEYDETSEATIRRELAKFVGDLDVDIRILSERPKDKKWRFTISKLSKKEILSLLS